MAVNEEKPQIVDVNKDTDELTTSIVAEMRVNPYITVTQLSEKLSVSRRSIERIIKRLRDESIITRQGASHGGYWVVNEN